MCALNSKRWLESINNLSSLRNRLCEACFLIDEKLKILKFMSEMTARVDTNEFAQKVGLAPPHLIQFMQELSKEGYLKKVGGGFAITEKGKTALKAVTPLPEKLRFKFFLDLGKPADVHAATVKEFREDVFKVSETSLEFHLYRGDFENWFRTAVGDSAFADELAKIKKTNLKGEELRKALLKAVDLKFGV